MCFSRIARRVRRDFQNVARTDDLVLKHWVKASMPEDLDYPFARFNVSCEVTPVCTKEEFEKVLATHKDAAIPHPWNFDDTVHLLQLCKRYELRWVVLADRFQSVTGSSKQNRTLEDMKYWYHEATRLLTELRHPVIPSKEVPVKPEEEVLVKAEETLVDTGTSISEDNTQHVKEEQEQGIEGESKDEHHALPLTTTTTASPLEITKPSMKTRPPETSSKPVVYRFNIAYEKQRKAQLEVIFNRSNAEESVIKKLQEELKTIEQQLKKAVLKADMKKKKVGIKYQNILKAICTSYLEKGDFHRMITSFEFCGQELAEARSQLVRSLPSGVFFRSTTQALPTHKMALSAKLTKKLSMFLEEVRML
jgi:DNA methyltransferase 1-associated protein 1